MKTLRELILEGIETLIIDHCAAYGINESMAFVIFITATAKRGGLLKKADEQTIPHIESIYELIPEIVDRVDRRLMSACDNEEEIASVAELAVITFFTAGMEVIGNMESLREDLS